MAGGGVTGSAVLCRHDWTPAEFRAWTRDATAGAVIEYHRGFLAEDRLTQRHLGALALAARHAANGADSRVVIFQTLVDPDRRDLGFSYRAMIATRQVASRLSAHAANLSGAV